MRPLVLILMLSGLAACEAASTGPVLDTRANDLGEAINEPTDGALNETEIDG